MNGWMDGWMDIQMMWVLVVTMDTCIDLAIKE